MKLLHFAAVLTAVLATCGCPSRKDERGAASAGRKMVLTSPAFVHGQPIPASFTADSGNVSPPLRWDNPPPGTKSFVLICHDPDAEERIHVHWVLFNIPGDRRELAQGASSPTGFIDGTREPRPWAGPLPPPGKPHRYFFRLYALDTHLDFGSASVDANLLAQGMAGHLLETAELIGTCRR